MTSIRRRTRRGQAIVLMALAMVAICGMMALAIDAGRLFFQRRLMQDAVDAGALAGAQALVGTVANPNGVPSDALFYALQDSLSVFNQAPANARGTSFYQSPPSNTVTDSQGGYTVTATAPSGYNNKQIVVTVNYLANATFAEILGFRNIAIVATATAEAGTNAKTYAIFAYGGFGTGNSINAQMSGVGQVDNGQNGADACDLTSAGLTISNAKFHIPTGSGGSMNINGRLVINQGSDNQNLQQFWAGAPDFGTGQDPKPDYLLPDVSTLPNVSPSSRWKVNNLGSGASSTGTGAFAGITVTNTMAGTHDVYVYLPGRYTSSVIIPWNGSGDAQDGIYIFLNGIYYFSGGVNLQITGTHVSNTSTGQPHYVNGVGATDLPAASNGVDGVEFIFDGSSAFSAATSASTTGLGSVFFVSPSFVPTGSTHIAFYIAATNTAGTAWTNQNFDASGSAAPRFQVWGTMFDASAGGGSVYLRAVQLGPQNLDPTDSDSSGQYVINGEFIGFVMTLDMGNVQGNAAGSPPACNGGVPDWTGHRGTPGLLAQFNVNFAPAPGVNSYLVK